MVTLLVWTALNNIVPLDCGNGGSIVIHKLDILFRALLDVRIRSSRKYTTSDFSVKKK